MYQEASPRKESRGNVVVPCLQNRETWGTRSSLRSLLSKTFRGDQIKPVFSSYPVGSLPPRFAAVQCDSIFTVPSIPVA